MNAPLIRPDVKAFLDFLNNLPGPKLHELPPAAARQMMASQFEMTDVAPARLAIVRDLSIPGPAGRIPVRFYDARETRPASPVLVYFHGGGFVAGNLDSHHPICSEIARALDIPVLAVDYRLAPENPWPAAPEDCEAAARWMAASPAELNRVVTGLVLAGDSAGGMLTAVTSLALRDAPAAVPVLAQWAIYPVADLKSGPSYPSWKQFADGYLLSAAAMEWFHECYAQDPSHPRASLLKANPAGLPPTLIVTAALDPLRDQGRAYAARLIEAGVPTLYREARGNIHGFVNLGKAIPSSAQDIQGCLDLLKMMIAEGGSRKMAF